MFELDLQQGTIAMCLAELAIVICFIAWYCWMVR